jgi:hypothetical protein
MRHQVAQIALLCSMARRNGPACLCQVSTPDALISAKSNSASTIELFGDAQLDTSKFEEVKVLLARFAQVPIITVAELISWPEKTNSLECPSCKGQGTRRDPNTGWAIKCERCDGKGVVSVPEE